MFDVFKTLVLKVAERFGARAAVEELFAAGVDPVAIAQWVITYRENLSAIVQKLIDVYKELRPQVVFKAKDCDPVVAELMCHQRCHLACMLLDHLELCNHLGCCDEDCDPDCDK